MVAKWNSLDESCRELRACVHQAFSRPPATCRVPVVSFFNGTRTHDSPFNPSTNGRLYPNLYRVPSLYVLFFFISQPLSLFAFATSSEFARFYFQITRGPAIPLEIAAISRTNEPLCRQSPRVSTLYFKRLPSHSKRQNQTGISDPCAHPTTVTISFLP